MIKKYKRFKNWCEEVGCKPTDFLGGFALMVLIAEFWILAYALGAR